MAHRDDERENGQDDGESGENEIPYEDRPYVRLEDMDEDTRREVLKTRHAIKLIGLISIGSIALMVVVTIIAVLLTYGD